METPQGINYAGRRMDTRKLCGVSVLRAGETMEPALCEVCKDIRLGKILIQTNLETTEPEVSQCIQTDLENPSSVSATRRRRAQALRCRCLPCDAAHARRDPIGGGGF